MLVDIAAERAVISTIVQNGSQSWIDCNDILSDDCFTDHINQCLYTTLEFIFKNNSDAVIDLASILSSAQSVGLKDLGEPDKVKYIKALFQYDVAPENTREFAKKVRKLSECRSLIGCLDSAAGKVRQLTGDESISEIAAIAEKPIFDFTNKLTLGNRQVEQIGTGIDDYFSKLESQDNLQGVSTGYPIYERVVGGLRVGVHIKGARNKTGKSFDALNSACYCSAIDKNPVLYLDTELRLSQGQWDRFLARFAGGVTIDDIKYGNFFENEDKLIKVKKAKNILKKIPLHYINITGKGIEEIISIIRRWIVQIVGYDDKGETNKCLVVYDYLKPPTTAGELKNVQEYQEIGFRLEALHNFTAQYSIPILTYVQLNKEHDKAASDRLGWYCTSYSSLSRKPPEEIANDGPQNGNLKLTPELVRHGEGLEYGDYINYYFNGKIAKIVELKTRNQVESEKKANDTGDNGSDQ